MQVYNKPNFLSVFFKNRYTLGKCGLVFVTSLSPPVGGAVASWLVFLLRFLNFPSPNSKESPDCNNDKIPVKTTKEPH